MEFIAVNRRIELNCLKEATLGGTGKDSDRVRGRVEFVSQPRLNSLAVGLKTLYCFRMWVECSASFRQLLTHPRRELITAAIVSLSVKIHAYNRIRRRIDPREPS